MRTSEHHHVLIEGKGKCSVPMWQGGGQCFCDKDAFGERPLGARIRDAWTGRYFRLDGKYDGYIPGLACPDHGGPSCPGIEIEDGVWSGCSGEGGDCPTCGK